MTPYLAILSARYRTLIQYRAAAFAGFVTQLFWGFIRIMILNAFYESTTAAQPLSLPSVIAYVWLGQAFLGLLPWNVDRDVQEMVRTGSLAYELVRPLGMYPLWFARAMAWRTATAGLRSIPLVVVAGLLLPVIGLGEWALPLPAGWAGLGLFILSISAAVLLSSSLTTLFNLNLIWTISGTGAAVFLPALVMIFSGLIIPLPLFPDWAQGIIAAMPFRGLADVPYRIYTGDIVPARAPAEIGLQLLWSAALAGFGAAVMARGTKRMTIQGG